MPRYVVALIIRMDDCLVQPGCLGRMFVSVVLYFAVGDFVSSSGTAAPEQSPSIIIKQNLDSPG